MNFFFKRLIRLILFLAHFLQRLSQIHQTKEKKRNAQRIKIADNRHATTEPRLFCPRDVCLLKPLLHTKNILFFV